MHHQPTGRIRRYSLDKWFCSGKRHSPENKGTFIDCPWLRHLLCAFTLFAIINGVFAATPTATSPPAEVMNGQPPGQLSQQRRDYKQALTAISHRDSEKLKELMPALETYPLYPYLHFKQLTADLSKLDDDAFRQFSNTHSQTSLPKRLRTTWLSYLYKRQRWDTFLAIAPRETSSPTLQCQRLWALHQTGKQQEALNGVAPLWTVGHSQPSSCDRIFQRWIKAGLLTEDLAWQRFWLALAQGNRSLARYSSRFIKDKDRARTTTTALNLNKSPKKLAKLRLPESTPGYTELVVTTLKRLARSDAEQAANLWIKFKPTLHLSTDEKSRIIQKIGLSLLQGYHPKSPDWIAKLDPKREDSRLQEWLLRFHLSQKDWQSIEKLVEQLPESDRLNGRWRYWEGRARENNGSKAKALSLYRSLAEERSFYGFLSAHRLGRAVSLNNQSLPLNSDILNQLSGLEGMARARELFHHQQLLDARREWWQLSRSFTTEQHIQSAHLARRWGWYTQAIQATINARQWNDLRMRFPAPFSDSIAKGAQRFSIASPLILAVARQESAFKSDAQSPAGAIGVMQLMPATAKQTARSINLPYRGRHQLKNPDTNIQLGSAYLSKMLKAHKGNRVYATAAYNAGPHRIKGWLQQRGGLPVDLWIETIPFDETRQYVQNVLSYAVIYSDLLGQPKQFLTPTEDTDLPKIY